MIVEEAPIPSAGPPLAAILFTAAGKMTATVKALAIDTACVTAAADCPDGSIAILVRHGIRVFATVHPLPGGELRLAFDDPLEGWRLAQFVDGRRAARTVVVADLLAA